jgi:hypothetical protein
MELDKNQIYVIDNFLSLKDQKSLLDDIVYSGNPKTYSFINTLYNQNFPSNILPEKQFVDIQFTKNYILGVLEKKMNLEVDKVIRIKTNWAFRELESKKDYIYPPHVDVFNTPHWVLLYYVNNSDGDTIFYNETENDFSQKDLISQLPNLTIKHKFTPKQGRAILFWGNRFHCGMPPVTSDFRILINHNFTIKE